MNNDFVFSGQLCAVADPGMNDPAVQTLWNRFCLKNSSLTLRAGAPFTFRLGEAELPVLSEGREYALRVTEKGAAIVGKDYGGLMRGFFSLLMKISCGQNTLTLPSVTEESQYKLRNRMLHICVFPENDLYFIKKLIRLAGLCQYTHIVIEFWGMLQFDCMKELAWPQAFTKAEAKELIAECRVFGMEPIPMFNHLGHATACRVKYGKHVVLDQDPCLQHYFTPDGWAWNIHSQQVRDLLKKVRLELYGLFGEGSYIHLGCDEAYYYTRSDEDRKMLPAFLADLTGAVAEEGRRPMVWMDMMLERNKYDQKYHARATCAPDEVEVMQNSLHPSTVMVDWQYDMLEAPIEPLLSLKGNIRDAMGAPWYQKANYTAYVDTIVQHDMFGIMMTTWHTLKEHMPSILGCAKQCGAVTFPWAPASGLPQETATMLRMLSFEGNTYADCGWSKKQIDV